MSDAQPCHEAALARLAREALTAAQQATLLIAEVGEADCEVVLYEHDGRPQFVCAPDSPVAGSVGCVAELHVPLGCARGGGQLELSGNLILVGHDGGEAIVELRIVSVIVQHGHHGRRREVAVETYLAESSSAFDEYAARLVAHTNASHHGQLREFAARLCGDEPSGIAAAALADLDASGVDLQWIDCDGFHLVRLAFGCTATDPQQLAALLRDQLHARPSHTNDRGDS